MAGAPFPDQQSSSVPLDFDNRTAPARDAARRQTAPRAKTEAAFAGLTNACAAGIDRRRQNIPIGDIEQLRLDEADMPADHVRRQGYRVRQVSMIREDKPALAVRKRLTLPLISEHDRARREDAHASATHMMPPGEPTRAGVRPRSRCWKIQESDSA